MGTFHSTDLNCVTATKPAYAIFFFFLRFKGRDLLDMVGDVYYRPSKSICHRNEGRKMEISITGLTV